MFDYVHAVKEDVGVGDQIMSVLENARPGGGGR
jgi:hypothetical protein